MRHTQQAIGEKATDLARGLDALESPDKMGRWGKAAQELRFP